MSDETASTDLLAIATGELLALVRALTARRSVNPDAAREQHPFTAERRALANLAPPTGGFTPPAEATTVLDLAHHLEVMICAFLGWPGNDFSDAELVYRMALPALRAAMNIGVKQRHRAIEERLSEVQASVQAARESQLRAGEPLQRDRCQLCLGFKGGRLGEEKIVGGCLACAECAELVDAIVSNVEADRAATTASDAEAAEIGQILQDTTVRAAEVQRQEDAGEVVSPVTPHGGEVTDPDEVELYRKAKELNLSRCTTCQNLGRLNASDELCACPWGEYLGKKLAGSQP